MYRAYNAKFLHVIAEDMVNQAVFTDFRDTGVYERYMLNAYQFSAAKDAAKAKLMQAEVFDEKGTVRSYSAFRPRALAVGETFDDQYLRVEYDMCRRQAVQAQDFRRMREDADLYPYWIYHGRLDSRERPEHRALEGLTFVIGDPAGDACFPPVDWNCFLPDTPVRTPDGWRRIDSIRIGEYVLGGSGHKHRVNFVHNNPFDGELFRIVNKRGFAVCTDNHRILTIKGWVTADRINAGDVIINLSDLPTRNNSVAYIKNCYVLARYICVTLIVKWHSRALIAFNRNAKRRDENIDPIWRLRKIVNNLKAKFISNMLQHSTLEFSGLRSGVNMQTRIEEKCSLFGSGRLGNDFGPKKAARNLLSFGLRPQPWSVVLRTAQIGMRKLFSGFTHFLAGLLLPIVCIYPLALDCFATMTNWYRKMVEKGHNSPMVHPPSGSQLPNGEEFINVKKFDRFGGGAPLDGFNSLNSFVRYAARHFEFNFANKVSKEKYIGKIYNLEIEQDETYVVPIGIVHNCRCNGKSADGRDVDESKVLSGDAARAWLEGEEEYQVRVKRNGEWVTETRTRPYIDPQFRYNPADQGMLPKEKHSYMQVLGSANDADYRTFGMDQQETEASGAIITGLAVGLHQMYVILEDWKHQYYTDKVGNVVFQNKAALANVFFTQGSFHAIAKHARGMENLPSAITAPDEVWVRWEDPTEQMTVLRNYLKVGDKSVYCVQTRDGVVVDAFAVSKENAKKFRKGLPL